LTPEQEQQLEELVLRGPEGTLVRWRRADLRDVIKREFGVDYHER
jgi:transposase